MRLEAALGEELASHSMNAQQWDMKHAWGDFGGTAIF